MIPNIIYLPYLMAVVNMAILLINQVRIAIGLLVVQYFLAFLVTLPTQSLRSILARLAGGLIVSLILFSADRRFPGGRSFSREVPLPRSIWFRFITGLAVILVAGAFANQYRLEFASVCANVFQAAVVNICLGILMLGLYQSPFEAAVGMLTLLIGFDLFYGSIEPSLAIIALLISIQLIIALATSYIVSVSHHIALDEEPYP